MFIEQDGVQGPSVRASTNRRSRRMGLYKPTIPPSQGMEGRGVRPSPIYRTGLVLEIKKSLRRIRDRGCWWLLQFFGYDGNFGLVIPFIN